MFPELGHWQIIRDGDHAAWPLYARHYSANKRTRYGRDHRFVAPGQKLVLVMVDGQAGVECTIFRNESNILSSLLILEAEELARQKWGGLRLFTYVNAAAIRSANPGYCFQCAGWRRCGVSKGGLVILEKIVAMERAA